MGGGGRTGGKGRKIRGGAVQSVFISLGLQIQIRFIGTIRVNLYFCSW